VLTETTIPVHYIQSPLYLNSSHTIMFQTVTFQSFAPAVFYCMRKKVGISTSEYLDVVSPSQKQDYFLEFISNSKSGQSFFFTYVNVIYS